MLYVSNCGRITIQMTLVQAESCTRPRIWDKAVIALSTQPEIMTQLRLIDPAALRRELRGLGDWDNEELNDHAKNLQRILYIAAESIVNRLKD